ncbi:MAG: lysoplasmalogenase [Treponema sp.]|nr:lysoplasmalogenase [Treponema sp.]
MKTIFLDLFIFDALFHIAAIFVRREWPRRISKALLLPLLLGYYVLEAEHFLFAVVLAGIFGWIGDILLILPGNIKIFIFGLLAFLLGHFCYIYSLLHFTESVEPAILIAAVIAAIPLGFIGFRIIRPQKTIMLPLAVYGIVLAGMAITAFCLMLSLRNMLGVVLFAGGVLFLVSDTILGYGRFRKGAHINDAAVMITYIAAQSCLLLGLARV